MENIKLPKIGQTVYWFIDYNLVPQESVITGVLVNENGKVEINLDHSYFRSSYDFINFNKNSLWFSKNKRDNVLKNKVAQAERKKKTWAKRDALVNRLKEQLPEVLVNYKDKEVLVKTGNVNNHTFHWAKTTIKTIYPHEESGSYYFTYNGNVYLLTKENKTWKFYTEKLKLEMEKEKLEKQLREIEEKLKGEQL